MPKNLAIATGISTLAFVVYLSTMSRSMPTIDGGEITTVLWTLGIAHPTGYPLFTLLGYLFVHIPFFSEIVVRANLFAAVCASIAGGIFYFVFFEAQGVFQPDRKNSSNKKSKLKHSKETKANSAQDDNFATMLVSAVAALSLIFSKTFWTQSTVVESYPLQLILFALILLTWMRFFSSPNRGKAFFAGLTLGLGFTNHMTTVLTVPALLFLLISGYRQKRLKLNLLRFTVLGGILAGLLYLYLPIRASEHPLMNWGNPHNLQRFIWHVTAKQFRTWMFSSLDVFEHQIGYFLSGLYIEFRITILIAALGIFVSFFLRRRLFWWATIPLLSDVFYAANYSIHNIDSYFLLAYVALSIFAVAGFNFLIEWFARFRPNKLAIAGILALFPLVSAFSNYARVDASKDYSVEMYTHDILTSVPGNSLILSFQWDNFVASSIYYQNVDSLRPDVIVIDKELLRRSWYAKQVHERFSFLFPRNDPVYSVYMENLRLFENDLPYDPNSIEASYSNYIREIITGAMRNDRSAFVAPEIEDQYLRGFDKVPFGLLFEIRSDTTYVPCDESGLDGFQAAKVVDTDYSRQIIGFYERMFLARAAYEYANKKLHMALNCINKALQVDPTSQIAQEAKLRLLQDLKASGAH